MTTWEENHAGVTARVGGRYRMKHVADVILVTGMTGDGFLTYQTAEESLKRFPVTGYLPVATFERQIESELA
jgi:hypothetical protein